MKEYLEHKIDFKPVQVIRLTNKVSESLFTLASISLITTSYISKNPNLTSSQQLEYYKQECLSLVFETFSLILRFQTFLAELINQHCS
ncbi:MAG TPA: hypothetical protein VG895_03260 [Patescibacteria group bacterium]|nr:hypothetical protein [Patescibacteria group bacterium]